MNELFIYPDGGLGNRLNCIYSGIYWQKYFGIKMKILWEINYACGISFEKLFLPLPSVEVKTIYNMSLKDDKAVCSLAGKLYIKRVKRTHTYLTSQRMCQIFSEGGGEKTIHEMIRSPIKYCIRAYEVFAEWKHILEIIDCLKPAGDIENRVNEIMDSYMNFPIVGIHIRRTDFELAIQNSPLYAFIDCMEKILKAEPNTYFYVATDDDAVELELSRRFPLIKRKTFSDKKSRRTEKGMMDAYVDMLCLGRCSKIYGSYASTFSNMAATIGRKECIIVRG